MTNIRSFQPGDLPALYAINVSGEPGVGKVTEEALGEIIAAGDCMVATDENVTPIGFLIALGPDAAYASKNYLWFNARYESFAYVDRIAVAERARGQGVGAALYQAAFAKHAGSALLIGCEVNTAPPNPRSMHFHTRLGFAEVGTSQFTPDYAVAYLARRLTP